MRPSLPPRQGWALPFPPEAVLGDLEDLLWQRILMAFRWKEAFVSCQETDAPGFTGVISAMG